MELSTFDWPHAPAATAGGTHAHRAGLVLGGAVLTGVVTQALFWRVPLGLNFLLWTVVALAGCLASVRPRRVTTAGKGAIAAALLLAFACVRFAGHWTTAIAVPATLALLVVLPALLRDEVEVAGVARLPLEAVRALRGTRRAARATVQLPRAALGGRHADALRVARGFAAGIPVTGLFVALLSADTAFAHAVGRIVDRLGEGLSFAVWSLATAVATAFAHALFDRPARLAAPPPLAALVYRTSHTEQGPSLPLAPPRVARSTWFVVLAQVVAVFSLFVGVNLRSLFGGHSLVRAPGSLTYARYLHAGFGQLLVATVLSICLVVAGHELLRVPGPAGSRGDVPGGRLLVAAETSLLGLTAVTVASCAQRLAIYEDAYGATRLRLGVLFVIAAVLVALALTAVKAVRREWGGYGGALASTFVGLAVVASATNADAYVARTNLDRAARGRPLDLSYLTTLSRDARAVIDHPYLAAHPAEAESLRLAYCTPVTSPSWRSFRGMGSCSP